MNNCGLPLFPYKLWQVIFGKCKKIKDIIVKKMHIQQNTQSQLVTTIFRS